MNTGILIGASLIAVSSIATVSIAENPVKDAVHKHINPLIDAGMVPGAVIAVRHKGIDSYYTLGTLAFDGEETPSFDTLYEIGSISKVMTGVQFADAIRRGEVTKHTHADDLLPDGVDSKDFKGTEVELWHLTTHTSGWPTAPANLQPTDPDRPFWGYTEEMLHRYISNVAPMREPGTEFEYSNLSVGLLGEMLADRAGMSYEEAVIERVFERLGIDDIQITLDADDMKRLAPATSQGRSTKPWGDIGPVNAAGMWVASGPAMLEFAVANLSDEDEGIYESLEIAREPMAESGFGQVCYGWMLAKDGTTYWHNGMTGGYSSYMAVNRDLDAAVVVLTNGATFTTTTAGEKLFQQLVGMNPDPIEIQVREAIDEDYAQQLIGEYKGELFTLYITSEAGKLFARVTGQQAFEVIDTGKDDRFRYEVVEAELGFDVPEDGQALSVTLYQGGAEFKCVRVEN